MGSSESEGSVIPWHQIPNSICVLRVVVVFAAIYFIGQQHAEAGTWSVGWLVALTLAALTDRLDGFLAKRYGWTSELGAFLDQTSDKLVTLAVFGALVVFGAFPLLGLVAVVFRELFVSGLRIASNRLSVPIRTGEAGRFKTFVQQSAALFIFLCWASAPGWRGIVWGQWLVWAGWGLFVMVMIGFGKRGVRAFVRVYSNRRVDVGDPTGREHVSYADLALVVATLLAIPLPHKIAGPVVVLTITLGTGITYFSAFLWGVRQRRYARSVASPSSSSAVVPRGWPGPLLVLAMSAVTCAGMALLLGDRAGLGTLWMVIGAISVLWVVLLAASAMTGRVYLAPPKRREQQEGR